MENYNSMAYTPEEVEQGLHLDLLNLLLDYNNKSKDHYNDIHITTDGYCTIIDWSNVSYDGFGGKFEFVDEDEVVAKELLFPDNHSELIYRGDEEQILSDWLKENPEYVKDNEIN